MQIVALCMQLICHIQFKCTYFWVHMIFLLMLKISMDKNFLLPFPTSAKKSLICLTFPNPLTNSQTFSDFPGWLENLSLLWWWKFQRSRTKTRGNSMGFSEHPWKSHFLVDSCNFHMSFPYIPGKSMENSDFFWNNP